MYIYIYIYIHTYIYAVLRMLFQPCLFCFACLTPALAALPRSGPDKV